MAREIKIPRHEQYKGSVYAYVVDMTLINQELGVTANDATWSTEDTSIVSIATPTFASPNSSAAITALNQGSARNLNIKVWCPGSYYKCYGIWVFCQLKIGRKKV